MNKSAIVVGAGIVGLATARALAIKGYLVTVIERSQFSLGASVRNFGMIWPIGQPEGNLYQRALRSKEVWMSYLLDAGIPFSNCGSLHLAYTKEEMSVIEELGDTFTKQDRPVSVISSRKVINDYHGVNDTGLIGALKSTDEIIIDPREGIEKLPPYLSEKYGIRFIWGVAVTEVDKNYVLAGGIQYMADLIFVCSGADFETLFPEMYKKLPITKTKLQMMRFQHTDPQFRIGAAICGGLSLLHYKSFETSASLALLRKKIETEMPEYMKNGIHVMVSQNNVGELTVGDSHEYGLDFDPFDRTAINEMIVSYLKKMMHIDAWKMTQSWNGIYPKLTNGESALFLNPMEGVYILNGIGGNGMTLSFGFAEEMIEKI